MTIPPPAITRQSTRRRTDLPSNPTSEGLETAETQLSRPPSPRGEEILPSIALENPGTLIPETNSQAREDMPDMTSENVEALDLATSPSFEALMVPDDDENKSASTEAEESNYGDESDHLFTKKPIRARSLDSDRVPQRNTNLKPVSTEPSKTLSAEQEKAVETATKQMTTEQQEQVARRQERVDLQGGISQNKAEASLHKGKAIDPRNWGNVDIAPEEMDVNTQKAMIDEYSRGQKEARKGRKDPRDLEKDFQAPAVPRHESIVSTKNAETRRAGSKPATQIVPNSSLGIALGNVAKLVGDPGDPDEPSSPSDYDSYSEHSSSTRSHSSARSRRRHSHKRRSKKKTRRSSGKSRSSIKPIPPKDYDGSPNARAYHRFVMEGEAYLRDGKVRPDRQIRILAHYLDGRAYDFFMQKVAIEDPSNWNLHKFFIELFNFCFPIDYRQQMRLKLEKHTQKPDQTVSEYVYELQELFSMVGAMPQEMKVLKLWYSLRARTQRAMWRDGLHPDSSTWDEVVAKAEMVEIADKVTDPRDKNKSSEQRLNSNSSYNNSNNGRSKATGNSSHATTSQSVSYVNRNRDNGSRFRRRGNSTRPNANQQRQNSVPSSRNHEGGHTPCAGISSNAGSSRRKSGKPNSLSNEEMAQLRSEGKCFNCKNVGHLSRNCPDKDMMPGNGKGKPPGIPSFSMEMEIVEDDDEANDIETLPVGCISVESEVVMTQCRLDEKWHETHLLWLNRQALARDRVVATTLFQMGWVIPGTQCAQSQAMKEMDFFHFFQCQAQNCSLFLSFL